MQPFRRRQLTGMELVQLDCSGHAFAKHAHDEFVIGVNLTGREEIWLDGKSHEASIDQVTLYNPAQVQAAHGRNQPWIFYSLYLDPTALPQMLDLAPDTAFEQPVLGDPRQARLLSDAAALSLNPATPDEQAHEAVLLALAQLFQHASGAGRKLTSRHIPASVHRTAERLRETANVSLGELAASAGLSEVQLVRAFNRAYGLPPFAWANLERLKQARHRLRDRIGLAELADELGFADQAHFSRRFKDIYGVSPGAWRRAAGETG